MATNFKRTVTYAKIGYAKTFPANQIITYNDSTHFAASPAPFITVTDLVKNKIENNSQEIQTSNKILDEDTQNRTLNYFGLFDSNPQNYIEPPPNPNPENIVRKLCIHYTEEYQSDTAGAPPAQIKYEIWYLEGLGIMADERNNFAPVGERVKLKQKYENWNFPPPGKVTPRTGGRGSTAAGGRGGRSSYTQDAELPIAYHSQGDLVKEVQKALANMENNKKEKPYFDILTSGSSKYGGRLSTWNATDGKFGPRTQQAIKAFYTLEKKTNAPQDGKIIDQTVYDHITKFQGLVKATSEDVAQAETGGTGGKAFGESVSYKKDLLKPTKNRHKELESLVFEKLVKECK